MTSPIGSGMISPSSALKYCNRPARALPFLLLASLLARAAFAAPGEAPFQDTMPYSPASHAYHSAALMRNPAFVGQSEALSLSYRLFSYNSSRELSHCAMLEAAGFALSYRYIDGIYDHARRERDETDAHLLGVGKGFFIKNYLGLGLGYMYSMSGPSRYNHYSSWYGGLLLRPLRWLSLGFVMRDINRPSLGGNVVPRREIYSLSVRPLRERLTLSCDLERIGVKRFNYRDLCLSAELRLPKEVSFFAAYNLRRNASFGVSMPIQFQGSESSSLSLDYFGGVRRDSTGNYSSVGARLSRESRPAAIAATGALLKLQLRGEIRELEPERFFAGRRANFFEILKALQDASTDPGISGIVLRIDACPLGLAQIQEIRAQLKRFRAGGKKVYALMTTSGNKEYYLACASDAVYLAPTGPFGITGLSASVYFLGNLLEKIGVKLESVRRGRYKSFLEPFTRGKMSDEYRENLTALLHDINRQYLEDIASDRRMEPARLEAGLAKGLYEPEEARRAGFVDEIEYPDDAEGALVKRHRAAGLLRIEDYISRRSRTVGWGVIPAIAVVHVAGSIVKGEGWRSGVLSRESTGDEAYRRMLQAVFKDGAVKAVVIRIHSGGGSAAASELMWHCLTELKKKYRKPVVISFGNIAASGGYYIACTGDRIFSGGASLTGSIGVIAGKLSLRRLYETLGIGKDTIKTSEFADLFSESRELTPAERDLLQRGVDFSYAQFTRRVMQGRGVPPEKIESLAEGRVFSGSQASRNGLVDEIGGIIAAVEYAKRLADLDDFYRVVHLPARSAPLVELLNLTSYDDEILSRLKPLFDSLKGLTLDDEWGLYLFPFRLDIQ